jgi:hypothetical protein
LQIKTVLVRQQILEVGDFFLAQQIDNVIVQGLPVLGIIKLHIDDPVSFFACGEGPCGRRPHYPNNPVDHVQFY